MEDGKRKELPDIILDKNDGTQQGRKGKLRGHKNIRVTQGIIDILGKSSLLNQAEELEREGLIECTWFDGKSELINIRYSTDILPRLYKRQGRRPPWEELEEWEERLVQLLEKVRKKWIRRCLEGFLEQILKGTVPADLKREKITECLEGIDELDEPIYKRLFSSRYLGNSKRFEQKLEVPVITLAKKYCEDTDEQMEDYQVLSQIYIEEYSQQLSIKGPLKIELEGRQIDLSKFCYGVTLNTMTLKKGKVPTEQNIKKIITVENKANFESMPYEDDTLIVFTHGFLAPLERMFLKQIKACEYYHTGDLDLGGIRIFMNIRSYVYPELKPYNMNSSIFRKYKDKGFGEAIGKHSYKQLINLAGTEELKSCGLMELAEIIIKEKWVIEQEVFLI